MEPMGFLFATKKTTTIFEHESSSTDDFKGASFFTALFDIFYYIFITPFRVKWVSGAYSLKFNRVHQVSLCSHI